MRNCWRRAAAIARSTTCRSGPRRQRRDGALSDDGRWQTTTRRKTAAAARRRRWSARTARKRRSSARPTIPAIVRRIWAFVKPYRTQIYISVAAVLVFTLTQLAIPLIIRFAIDNGMIGGQRDRRRAGLGDRGASRVVILINYAAS